MSSSKKWKVTSKKGGFCEVDTPNIIRARELRDLYYALNLALLSIDERFQILLHIKYTVKEFDCNLSRDIVDLIDREGDLLSRGRDPKSLEGLRKRISNLFLQFMQTPEFNPEAKFHQKVITTYYIKVPFANNSETPKDIHYCKGCTKYLSLTEFHLSSTLKQLGRCKTCTITENFATKRREESLYFLFIMSYSDMLLLIKKHANNDKNKLSKSKEHSLISLLQDCDVRFLVDSIWNRKSAISENQDIESLVFTRWDINKEVFKVLFK